VQYSRKTGQEGPVRAGGQVIVRLGCGGVGGAVRWCMASWAQARCLSVCLSASEAYLWSSVGERDKHGGTSTLNPRLRELGRASPHLSPLTANCNAFSEDARSSDIMHQCPGLIVVWSEHATVWSLFEALGSTCCITTNAQHAAVTSYSNGSIPLSRNISR